MNDKIIRQMVRKILLEGFAEDLAKVSSGKEAKQVFSKHVDQNYFRKGTLVHWVGPGSNEEGERTDTWDEVSALVNRGDSKSELSCSFYKPGEEIDFIPYGTLKNLTQGSSGIRGEYEDVVGVVLKGWVTYAANQNIFTGSRDDYDGKKGANHRLKSSGRNKYPWENYKDPRFQKMSGVNYLEKLRDASTIGIDGDNIKPRGDSRASVVPDHRKDRAAYRKFVDDESKDQSWMEYYKNWNEVLVDNWKIVGIVWAHEEMDQEWAEDYNHDYELGNLPIKFLPNLEVARKR